MREGCIPDLGVESQILELLRIIGKVDAWRPEALRIIDELDAWTPESSRTIAEFEAWGAEWDFQKSFKKADGSLGTSFSYFPIVNRSAYGNFGVVCPNLENQDIEEL